MKRQIPAAYVATAALLILALVAYMVLVRPKKAEQKRLDAEIAGLQTQLAATAHQEPPAAIRVADLFKLSKAIPDQQDMPGIILELNSTASAAGISFNEIEPQPAVPASTYSSVPINLVFAGNYYDLVDFLFRLRNLVSVNDGVLDASGRLFTLDQITLVTDPTTFPSITAKLTVSAFVFGSGSTPATTTPPAGPSTQTGTTPTTSTTTPTTGADASQQAAGG